jgi:hypothetical protein
MTKQHYLSVGAIFKNENHAIKEWIDHYLSRGVDHFYLINDNSTDNFRKTLQPYIDSQYVTLYHCNEPKYNGRQRAIYWKYFQPILNNQETKWLGIFDLDEFLYSPKQVSISNTLKKFENYGQILVDWVPFGSNGHIKQPDSIVNGFTKTIQRNPRDYNTFQTKYIVNSSFPCFDLGVHASSINGPISNLSWRGNPLNPVFMLNHYSIQSEEFWKNIKMTRGDVNCHFKTHERDMSLFKKQDINDIEDIRLVKQNESINKFVCKPGTNIPYNFPYFPDNTFHQYAQNYPGGSKHGEDGILNVVIKKLKLNRRHVMTSPTFIEAFPATPDAYSLLVPFISQWWKGCFIFSSQSHNGYVDRTFTRNEKLETSENVEKRVVDLVKENHTNSNKKTCCFLSVNFNTWEKYIETPYYQDGAPFIVGLHITQDILTFENFVTMVLVCSKKHYHPIALTKKYLICIRGEQLHKLGDFPYVVSDTTKGYIGKIALLYTNLYYSTDKWCVDPDLNIEVAKRNYYIKNKKLPTEKDISTLHESVNKYSHEIISIIT